MGFLFKKSIDDVITRKQMIAWKLSLVLEHVLL
jgi:hypothetical protein